MRKEKKMKKIVSIALSPGSFTWAGSAMMVPVCWSDVFAWNPD